MHSLSSICLYFCISSLFFGKYLQDITFLPCIISVVFFAQKRPDTGNSVEPFTYTPAAAKVALTIAFASS